MKSITVSLLSSLICHFFVVCNCNLYILFIYPFIYTKKVQNSMVNQSLKFLEYFCFTVDYPLHFLKRAWIFWGHRSQELFLACMFQVKRTKMLWKLQGSCLSHFYSCKHYNYQLFQETRTWSQARHLQHP